MDQLHSTTQHVKGKHLSYDDRHTIEIRFKDGWSSPRIAREIGCCANTVRNEIKRGLLSMYNGHVDRYKASRGQEVYEIHRANSCRNNQFLEAGAFIKYVQKHFFEDNWSLDACYGRAIMSGEFTRSEIVCTKTIYNYVAAGLLDIKNIDLPEKLSRHPKARHTNDHKKRLGRSIDERESSIELRDEFGHWEFDLVVGKKTKDEPCLLSMIERKTRNYTMMVIPNQQAGSVMEAIRHLHGIYGNKFSEVFKTITTDNGSEFSQMSNLEDVSKILVYYAHPYTSCERGSVECHNGIIRRFIKKGKSIADYSLEYISNVELWCNGLPRKILGYHTPEELFDNELDAIYSVA